MQSKTRTVSITSIPATSPSPPNASYLSSLFSPNHHEEIMEKCSSPEHGKKQEEEEEAAEGEEEEHPSSIHEDGGISNDIDHLIALFESSTSAHTEPPHIPDTVDKFANRVETEIAIYESGKHKWSQATKSGLSLLDDIDRLAKLSNALTAFSSRLTYSHASDRTNAIVQRAMCFLEEEFLTLLDPSNGLDAQLTYPPEAVPKLRRMAELMINTGFETECCQVFSIARRNALDAGLASLGFEKIGIDEMQKMPWESLEREIATWIKAFRQSVATSFAHERSLCDAVFSGTGSPGHHTLARSLFSNLARGVVIQLLNFAEAVAMTKHSPEKLFKVLDMYETLRDMVSEMDTLFPGDATVEHSAGGTANSSPTDLKSQISSARCRLGEAAISIFCDLESSVRTDAAKMPVPGGAVHPLTRYVMNYLKYACEYKNTLDQVFQEHHNSCNEHESGGDGDGGGSSGTDSSNDNKFVRELMVVMDLLHSNLDSKSKLYKDLALSYIFLMNNGRYIMQKIKGSAEAYELLGDSWCRKRSADLRQYHKNYQRETWSKVLGCFREEGLVAQPGGRVSKVAVKERLKSFNTMLEDIHKTQSAWVVSDEQLQSELRISVSAVVVPAYRSFLGRYRQYFEGRQAQKYIKFAPEDIESYIDELFDGNHHHSPAVKKKAVLDHANHHQSPSARRKT